jgi:hypothetical protein
MKKTKIHDPIIMMSFGENKELSIRKRQYKIRKSVEVYKGKKGCRDSWRFLEVVIRDTERNRYYKLVYYQTVRLLRKIPLCTY